jgi:Mg2+ and Co2+ transporter CorA
MEVAMDRPIEITLRINVLGRRRNRPERFRMAGDGTILVWDDAVDEFVPCVRLTLRDAEKIRRAIRDME